MLNKEQFSALYGQYEAWAKSQESQTNAMDFEDSFSAFLAQFGSDLLQKTIQTDPTGAAIEQVDRVKKKS